MFKKINNWFWLMLIAVVSVFSLALIQQNVLAGWQEPPAQPPETNLEGVVFNPLVGDLDLNDHIIGDLNYSSDFLINPDPTSDYGIIVGGAIDAGYFKGNGYFNGDLHVTGDLTVDGSGGGGSSYWLTDNGIDIYYNGGKVGINTDTPNEKLSVEGYIELKKGIDSVRYIVTDEDTTGTGKLVIQSGWGSANSGGALNLFADDHVKGGSVSVGLSNNPNAKFTVNQSGLANGADVFVVQYDGKVGIGTISPNKQLHVYKNSGDNAEIDIQSVGVAGDNNHWAIYHDRTSDDLRFWNNDPIGDKNILTITNDGRVGINKSNPDSFTSFQVYNIDDWGTAIKAENSDSTHGLAIQAIGGEIGVSGTAQASNGVGVSGLGQKGIKGESNESGGYGVWGVQNTGLLAGFFQGDVSINGGGLYVGNVGEGTSEVKIEVQADDDAYAGANTNAYVYDGYGATVAGIYGKSGANTVNNGWNYGVYGKADNPDQGISVGIAGTAYNADNSYAGYFRGDVNIVEGGLYIGTSRDNPSNVRLEVEAQDNQSGIYAYAGDNGGLPDGYTTPAGVIGESGQPSSGFNFGIYGKAEVPLGGTSVAVGGTGANNANSYAGYFRGNVKIITIGANSPGNLSVQGSLTTQSSLTAQGNIVLNNSLGNSYLQLDYINAAPPANDCIISNNNRGKMIYNYSNKHLYICDGLNGWLSVEMTGGGGGP